MADAGAIKAGDAYVEMALDKSKLDKGLADAGKGGAEALAPIDARMKQLMSSLWRMTGAIAIIRISAAAIEGAFSQMAAERSMEKALARGDLSAAVAEMRKAEIAQEGLLRNLPLIGGYIGRMFDAFKDRSLEQFAKEIAEADDKGRAFAQTLDVLREAEMALAKARGETPAQLAARSGQTDKEKAEMAFGEARAAWGEARVKQDEVKIKRDELAKARPLGAGITTEEASKKGAAWHVSLALLSPVASAKIERAAKQLGVLDAELTARMNITNRARGAFLHLQEARSVKGQEAAVKAGGLGEVTGMQAGAALAGAGPSGVAWGAGATAEATPAEQLLAVQQGQSATLESINGMLVKMADDMAKTAVNTSKPPPSPYRVN